MIQFCEIELKIQRLHIFKHFWKRYFLEISFRINQIEHFDLSFKDILWDISLNVYITAAWWRFCAQRHLERNSKVQTACNLIFWYQWHSVDVWNKISSATLWRCGQCECECFQTLQMKFNTKRASTAYFLFNISLYQSMSLYLTQTWPVMKWNLRRGKLWNGQCMVGHGNSRRCISL